MSEEQEQKRRLDANAQLVSQAEGSSVSTQVADTVGVLILGFICVLLLLALLRSQKQMRRLLERQIKMLQQQVG